MVCQSASFSFCPTQLVDLDDAAERVHDLLLRMITVFGSADVSAVDHDCPFTCLEGYRVCCSDAWHR